MARKPQDLLPGIDEPIDTQADAPDEIRAPRKSRAKNGGDKVAVSTMRVAVYSIAAALALGVVLYAFHVVEQFLIGDTRFALNGPEGSEETPTFTVAGAGHAPIRALEAVFRSDLGKSVYLIPLDERRLALRAVDWVKDASIARLWPNRLMVRVWERTPVAFVPLPDSKFGLIDEEGVVMPPAPDRFRLPVLRGVRAEARLAERHERVRRMLRLTGELGKEATAELSEIDVEDRDNLRVTLPYEGRILTLLLGDHNFAVRYQNFKNHFAEIRRRIPDAGTLDLRLEDRITVVE